MLSADNESVEKVKFARHSLRIIVFDLLLATETEAVQAEAATDIGKDRFDSCHSSTIYKAACYRVDLAPHLLRKGLSIVFCLSGIVSDLARFCLVGEIGRAHV